MTTFLLCWFILAAGHFSAYTRDIERYQAFFPPPGVAGMIGLALFCLLFWWVISLFCLADGYQRFFR